MAVCAVDHTHTHIYIYIYSTHTHTHTRIYILIYSLSLIIHTHKHTHKTHTHKTHTHTKHTRTCIHKHFFLCHIQERYNCPVYLHSYTFGGRMSNRASDVEDCLFDLQLPTGLHCPMHWITRNVVMLVAPSSLREWINYRHIDHIMCKCEPNALDHKKRGHASCTFLPQRMIKLSTHWLQKRANLNLK